MEDRQEEAMKIRKSGLLQRMMAVLLAAVLVVGVASDTAPMTVLAQEDTASLTQDGQTEIAEGDTADTVEKDTEPEETDSEEETPKPDEEPEQETPASDKGTEEDTPEPEEETETNPEEAEEIRTDEDGQDVQALLARIAALPDPEEYLATEPDADDWAENEDAYEEACTEWLAGLYEYADEALAIQEEVEKLTEEQRAQISEEELQKLAAWAEIAQTAGEMVQTPEPGAQVMAVESSMMLAAEPAPQADLPVTRDGTGNGWTLTDGKLTITSNEGMGDWISNRNSHKSDVTSAEIQDGVTSIGANAFWQCSSLEEITILADVTSIGANAFYECSSLKEITIPASVTSIGNYAFAGCSNLTEITIPGSVTSIGISAFSSCSSLKEITILAGVTSIGQEAFWGCIALKSITLPASVTSIGERAFLACKGLESITIPAGVTAIGDRAFAQCMRLATVTMLGDPPTLLGTAVFGMDAENCLFIQKGEPGIHVPAGRLQAYQTAEGWTALTKYIVETSGGSSGSGGHSGGSGSSDSGDHGDGDDSDSDSGSHSDSRDKNDSEKNNNSNDGFAGDGNTYSDAGGNSDSDSGSSGANGATGGSPNGANAVAAPAPAKAPATVITTPPEKLEEAVLTAEEKQQKAGGADIRIELDVKAVAAEAAAADKALVETALSSSVAKGYTLGQYLAINLYKVAGDSRTAITQTNGKIRVMIDVPDSLKNTDAAKTRTFAVIRAHDGKAQLLADLDQEADTITIETDRFSTYAIVYKDTAAAVGNPASGDGGAIQLRAKSGSKASGSARDDEPETGDATLAMIAGFGYLLLYVTDRERGMTEERKKELVSCLVGWAKQGGRSRKYLALAAIFVLLVYYHSIGKKTCTEWKAIYGE